MSRSSEQVAEYLKALAVERDGYERTGREDRAAVVDAEIERVKDAAKSQTRKAQTRLR